MKEKELKRWFGISSIMTIVNLIGFMILNHNIYSNLAGYTFGRSFQVFLGLIFSSIALVFITYLLTFFVKKVFDRKNKFNKVNSYFNYILTLANIIICGWLILYILFAILGLDCCSGNKTYLLYLDVTTNIMTFLFYISLFSSFVILFGNNFFSKMKKEQVKYIVLLGLFVVSNFLLVTACNTLAHGNNSDYCNHAKPYIVNASKTK